MNEKAKQAIEAIVDCLNANPGNKITELGCGCFARRIENGDATERKIIIGGDTFDGAKLELYYVLHDLGVDCHIPDNLLEALRDL